MKTITSLINKPFVSFNDLDGDLKQLPARLNDYLGHLLGFYQALCDGLPLTAYEIAIWTGSDEAFVYDWLEQQAAAGILVIEAPEVEGAARRFRLSQAEEK